MAARGEGPIASDEMIEAHLELVREMLPDAIAWQRQAPRPPLDGNELAAEIGLTPGPRMGEILEELRAAELRRRAGGPRRRGRAGPRARRRIACQRVADDCLFCGIVTGTSRARRSTPTSAPSPSWTSTRRRAATRSSFRASTPPTCSRSRAEDLEAVSLAAQRLAKRAKDVLGADGVNLINSCGARRLADGLPLPHARRAALRRRPARAALGPGARRFGRDRRGRGRAEERGWLRTRTPRQGTP